MIRILSNILTMIMMWYELFYRLPVKYYILIPVENKIFIDWLFSLPCRRKTGVLSSYIVLSTIFNSGQYNSMNKKRDNFTLFLNPIWGLKEVLNTPTVNQASNHTNFRDVNRVKGQFRYYLFNTISRTLSNASKAIGGVTFCALPF